MEDAGFGGAIAAGQAGTGLVEFLLWAALAVAMVVMFFGCSALWKAWQMPPGQRNWAGGLKLCAASLVLSAPIMIANMFSTALLGEDADRIEEPDGFLFDSPFNAPPPKKPDD